MKKFWNLVIWVLAAALVYQLHQAGKLDNLGPTLKKAAVSIMTPTNRRLPGEQTTTAMPAATPIFATESDATPEPIAVATPFFTATPEPIAQPVASEPIQSEPVVSTPPKQEEVDLGGLDRRYWPKRIKLHKAIDFFIMVNGKEVGKLAAPVGTMVQILAISGSQITVAMPDSSASQTIPAADTDIRERVREILGMTGSAPGEPKRPSAAPTAAMPPATRTSAPFVPKLNDRGRTPFERR